ncbi:MAG: hypothetical protein GX434_14030 [Peptococcaceae bacterium]|nr:hypothetical protein [Peptococcaceae bacterium]
MKYSRGIINYDLNFILDQISDDYSKIEAGRIELEDILFDLHHVLTNFPTLLHTRQKAKI